MKIYIVNTFLPELNKAKKIAKIILDKRLAACVKHDAENLKEIKREIMYV